MPSAGGPEAGRLSFGSMSLPATPIPSRSRIGHSVAGSPAAADIGDDAVIADRGAMAVAGCADKGKQQKFAVLVQLQKNVPDRFCNGATPCAPSSVLISRRPWRRLPVARRAECAGVRLCPCERPWLPMRGSAITDDVQTTDSDLIERHGRIRGPFTSITPCAVCTAFNSRPTDSRPLASTRRTQITARASTGNPRVRPSPLPSPRVRSRTGREPGRTGWVRTMPRDREAAAGNPRIRESRRRPSVAARSMGRVGRPTERLLFPGYDQRGVEHGVLPASVAQMAFCVREDPASPDLVLRCGIDQFGLSVIRLVQPELRLAERGRGLVVCLRFPGPARGLCPRYGAHEDHVAQRVGRVELPPDPLPGRPGTRPGPCGCARTASTSGLGAAQFPADPTQASGVQPGSATALITVPVAHCHLLEGREVAPREPGPPPGGLVQRLQGNGVDGAPSMAECTVTTQPRALILRPGRRPSRPPSARRPGPGPRGDRWPTGGTANSRPSGPRPRPPAWAWRGSRVTGYGRRTSRRWGSRAPDGGQTVRRGRGRCGPAQTAARWSGRSMS